MTTHKSRAIVVEGGAMRGIFAAGVLDGFMRESFKPYDFAIGVSAGSTNLIGYLTDDYQRSYRILTELAQSKDFIDPVRGLLGGHFCDVEWLWRTSYKEIELHFSRYLSGHVPLYVVTTQVEDGAPCYIEVTENNLHQLFPASCAIPLAFRDFPEVEGVAMTDGGVADSIPVLKAYAMGAREITVVLSRAKGYRKKNGHTLGITRRILSQYPKLCDAIEDRAERYNATVDFIENPPDDCVVHIIAPPEDMPVGRFTRQRERLDVGYNAGLRAAFEHIDHL
ncbi:patatin family protein [Pseudidiomarina sp. 1APP75-32.1]|uniref:Patatin family protein n=1 Tax=Pseudidiomarina terrestris TaxID=2820060 RepID=A0AAW7R3F9_9GAMM|nr:MULTISPECIES: patatin family protein [unclassified Pseudidiomarina]MDN7125185.1 patatin family protein [Pseudidiomarina sp. 1APP75-32.1]MEA3588949.1 patatin family protein [Pseudidiomarina sp. 1APP75-27a]